LVCAVSMSYVYKDYKDWIKNKRYINNIKSRPYFHEREVWYCYLGENIGYEQDGKSKKFLRPVLIYKKFNQEVGLLIPLTTKNKKGKFYFRFKIRNIENFAILSQIKFFDSKRLAYKISYINHEDFNKIKTKIRKIIS
jgi:mRNA interferase MazF